MYYISAFGKRYLWLDCLSVIQHSETKDMDKMLTAMAHIYTSAGFTILASQRDNAHFRLRGVGGPCLDREVALQKAIDNGGNGFP